MRRSSNDEIKMISFKSYLKKNRKLIDKELDVLLPEEALRPKDLHRAVRYSVFSGGKRVRPILAIEACILCGGQIKDVMNAACAIEMIHTSSLIHDDLPSMDDDDYRRGKPTCHRKFGEATAILAGDALLARAFGVMARGKKSNRLGDAIRELSATIGTLGMIGGQDEELRKRRSLNRRDMDFIIEGKTASLFKTSMRLGAIFGSAGKREEKALSKFGRFLGIAFQLIDDSFDNDGYARIIGKEKTKRRALEFINRAKDELRLFGWRAERLRELADFVINRKK